MSARARLLTAALIVFAVPAWAQPLGQFSWQLQPYCNVVTASVVQNGGVYTLDGFDDQCGAAQRAPLTGLATPNPDGTIGFGLTIVSAPGGVPVHVAARITLAALSGTWTDSAGTSGAFAFGARTGGSPRPAAALSGTQIVAGSVGVAQVNTAQVQARITGLCPAGQFAIRVNADGTLDCDVPVAPPADFGGAFRSVIFSASIVSGATSPGTAQTLETLTFTPPRSGTVLLRARGTCYITSLTTGSASLILGMFQPAETGFTPAEIASVGVPAESPAGDHRLGFAAERLLAVNGGTTYQMSFRAYHSAGATAATTCQGSYSAMLFTSVLP